jgi:hypothetical protein
MTNSSLSAAAAAAAVGMTKAGLIKAIRQGKISAEKDRNGAWQIEPVELFRVYAPMNGNGHAPVDGSFQEDTAEQLSSLQREMALLRELLATKDEVIYDLRRRLDDESNERQKLTAVLSASLAQPARPTGFWRRLLGLNYHQLTPRAVLAP